jgi:hypothetical protein
MDRYKSEATSSTPLIDFILQEGTLDIKGRSIPENSFAFYHPLTEALTTYIKSPKERTTVNVELEYFNTSSAKCLLDFFKALEGYHGKDTNVTIKWGYQDGDENILEAGKEYQSMLKMNFELVQLEEE